uniref:Ovule protein n=1 Tax=Romanomermis culicivorax TaxID=13658 RepID=A0A915JNV5_ROMCU
MKRCRLSKQNVNLAIPKNITVKLTTEYLLLGQLIKCIMTFLILVHTFSLMLFDLYANEELVNNIHNVHAICMRCLG